MPWLSEEEQWALTLTTFAGLSTSIGAAFAVSGGWSGEVHRASGQAEALPLTAWC